MRDLNERASYPRNYWISYTLGFTSTRLRALHDVQSLSVLYTSSLPSQVVQLLGPFVRVLSERTSAFEYRGGSLAKSSSMVFVLVFSCSSWANLARSASLARSSKRSRAAISANRARSAVNMRSCSDFLAS